MKTPISNLEELCDAMLSTTTSGAPPAYEKVLDGLGTILYAVDETFHILQEEHARVAFAWVEPHIQAIYDTVNELMKKLSD